jgi:ligand-binding sensor domain-containing protein
MSVQVFAQNPEWITYSNGNLIRSIVIEGDYIWVGTSTGLVKLNKTTGEPVFYNTSNSGLPGNDVRSLAIDGSGNKWIGTNGGGLVEFDGTNWTVYNTSNSGLPVNSVYSPAIDGSGNKWIGTFGGGLAKFDGTNWTTYNTSNSDLPDNDVYSLTIDVSGNKWIGTFGGGLAKFDGTNWTVYTWDSGLPDIEVLSLAIDGSGNKWIGTWGDGLAKFDGTNWTVYSASNSGLPDSDVFSLAIDGSGNKWIGTYGGLAKFDSTNWTIYNILNSGLPNDKVFSLAIDGSGNKWIGTDGGGLAVYKEGGIVSVQKENDLLPDNFVLEQNYPNPFNPSTNIRYSIPVETHRDASLQMVTLKVYDVLGKEVAILVNEEQSAGNYEVNFDASKLSSGVYFYTLTTDNFKQSKKMILLK